MMMWIAVMGLIGGSLLTVKHNNDEWVAKAGYAFCGAAALGVLLHLLGYI